MNTPFQPPTASISLLWNWDFLQLGLYLSTWSGINGISKRPIMTTECISKQASKMYSITALWLIYCGSEVTLAHLTQQKCYMALLRNIDCRDTYTSSSFVIDNFVQGELSIFVECKVQYGVFIPSPCEWLRCFSVNSAAETQGVSIGSD